MHGLDRARRVAGHRKRFQLAQHLQHGDGAAAGRRHAAQLVAAIGATDRVARLGAVIGQVRQAQVAGRGMPVHRGHDVAGDVALIERIRAGEFRILQHMAHRPRRAVRRIEICRGSSLLGQGLIACQERSQAG
ncbi:hypothetical protein D3C71_1366970 [compost metagenome]